MPSVLVQFQPSADSTFGEVRIFSRYFNEYRAVTTPTPGEDPKIKRAARCFRGGSPEFADAKRSDAEAIAFPPSRGGGGLGRGVCWSGAPPPPERLLL